MGRLVLVAVASVAVVVSLSLSPRLAAEQAANRSVAVKFPVEISGAVPGLNLELYLNSGKVADVPINPQGEGQWVLDLGNLGKTRMQVTVERCEDGQNVQRVYFADPGVTIPEDSKCKRRPVGAAWWSDCGVTRITLDLTRFGMRVVGCGSLLTQPKVYGPLGGAVVVGGLLLTGGGDGGSTTPVSTSTPTPGNTTVTTVTPPAPTPTPTPTPTVGSPAGTHNLAGCSVADDQARHDPTIQMCVRLLQLLIASPTAGAMSVLGASPFIAMSGTYSTSTGVFNLSATGVVAGFSNTVVRFQGTITASGDITGATIVFGENGTLPTGRSITYRFTTTRNR